MTGRRRMQIGWAALGLAWLLFFAGMEGYALWQEDAHRAITLSRFVYEISAAWPPIIFLLGLTVGVLTQHFWGHVGSGWYIQMHPAVRAGVLAACALIIAALLPGGAAIFVLGFAIGLLVTALWWPWDPDDATDKRG